MNVRLLVLHARARRVPGVTAGLGALAVTSWALGTPLARDSGGAGSANLLMLTVMAPLVAAVLISSTFSGADDGLELSTRSRWAALRAGPLTILTLLASALLALTGGWVPQGFGAQALVRGVVGEVGLVALTAVIIGARASWVPALVLAIVALTRGPTAPATSAAVLTWQVQPSDGRAAGVAVLVLGVTGLAVQARCGARVSAAP